MQSFPTPRGMNRRHFLTHLAGATALASPALALTQALTTQAATLKSNQKSCILLWMGGGPPTIDIWDMKPGAPTGGSFKPISTSGEGQITELLPKVAQQMHRLSIVRSMSTREADHERGRYYMHTGFVPNPNVQHPSYGSVVAHELANKRQELEIPPFVSIGGASEGPGFLGMAYAPFQVDSNGRVRNAKTSVKEARMMDRVQLLDVLPVEKLLADTFRDFLYTNGLGPSVFRSLRKFESEVVAMTVDLLGAPDGCGNMTTGGTESILMAVRTAREWAADKRGITEPEMILPVTAHPAFEKGGHLFGVKVVHAPVDPSTTQVDLDFVRGHINDHTILLVGSAANYPYGTVDPIAELSEIAETHDLGLHVDACLGGFILPWGEQLGYDIPVFDFRLSGVTSISADTHKFGFGLKGTSTLLCRSHELRRYQYFMTPDWPGGKYNSPGIAGSRSACDTTPEG